MKKLSLLTIVLMLICYTLTIAQETGQSQPVPKTTVKIDSIQLKEIKPFSYCALELTGSYEQHAEAFGRLYEESTKQTLDIEEIPFGIYWSNPQDTPTEQLKWELGFALLSEAELKEPLKLKKWAWTTLVTQNYEGPYESPEMTQLYGGLFQWIEKNGYAPAGPMMEKFLNQPVQNEAGQWSGKVEIVLPVQKIKK
ncbi:GyrI-like domain-containing protein [candidate division KSB1 bacterium]|nr:GyrI-like domain-containing protein [candidate division KSB1 bacterium]